jgi:hypothetical protein
VRAQQVSVLRSHANVTAVSGTDNIIPCL